MRCLIAGIVVGIVTLCLSAACAPAALGQATGEVESVGFGGNFRPACWTPMVVRLKPTTSSPFNGRLEVVQEDIDKDRVHFTRQFTLTGNSPDGSIKEQRFWMYFMPQPTQDLDGGPRSLRELSDILKVRILSEGGKELVRLDISQRVQPVESVKRGMSGATRGQKLVLVVHQRNVPNLGEYVQMIGLNEDVLPPAYAKNLAQDLPDRVIGYDAIDAVIWTDADPLQLSPEQYKALQEYVARGGRLVISQDTSANQWQRNNAALAQLMPVVVEGVVESEQIRTLRELARVKPPSEIRSPDDRTYADLWNQLPKPFTFARARVKEGAFIVEFDEGVGLPYIVRKPHGAGSVTWVAQDLGNPQLFGRQYGTPGWSYVWDRILDWPNDPVWGKSNSQKAELYKPHVTYELGRSMLKYMDLPSTSAALISIAVLFFIVYWVAAGPGSYLVLSKKNKATMSWFAFAGLAIAATGLTWVIVKLVLRGDAQLQHVSYVRMAPGIPAMVHSDFGLYIPRDGEQKIELKDAAPGAASYVTAFNLHPAFNETENEFPAKQDYRVPVMEVQEQGGAAVSDPKVVRVPYRSTLKKFQSQWVGQLDKGVTVTSPIELAFGQKISGRVRNDTGRDLRQVYIVVRYPGDRRDEAGGIEPEEDWVLYVQQWSQGTEIDVSQMRGGGVARLTSAARGPYQPNKDTPMFRGVIGDSKSRINIYGFADYWYDNGFRVDSWGDREWVEDEPLTPRSFPILSFFDRIPPCKNERGIQQQMKADRVDLLRRGLRHLDMSSAVTGGQMAIIAVADGKDQPLPFPMEVQGDLVKGQGLIYYQFIVPVDRKAVADAAVPKPPTTQPTTKPQNQAEGRKQTP
jgi:hypothetical protein